MFRRFIKDEQGNFALMFAGAAMCIVACVGVAVDYSTMSAAKQKLQAAVDSAALAGAIVADKSADAERSATVYDTFAANDFSSVALQNKSLTEVAFTDSSSLVSVNASAQVQSFFLKYLNKGSSTVTASASVSYAVDDIKPIALAFVLDVSGSMDSVITGDVVRKIEALKGASEELFLSVEKGIGTKASVETVLSASLSSYNTDLVPAWTTDMMPERSTANGTSTPTGQTARGTITTLTASGGTNSTPAVQDAFDKLTAAYALNPDTQMFMLFMTDGNNNNPAEDTNTAAICDQIKDQGILLFSVAFDAPANGEALLMQCASSRTDPTDTTGAKPCDKPNPPKKCEALKQGYYFDASDAKDLEDAFKVIGDNIGEQNIIIRS